MDIIQFLQKLFGNKSQRDMKLIQPFVEKIKAVYPTIDELDDDALRAKTKELQEKVQHSADDIKEKINELKGKVEETPIENRETIFTQIDKLEKDVLERFEKALDEVMPEAFSIVKPLSSEITCPPVRIAISSNIAFLLSPKPGAFTAAILSEPLNLFTTKVANASPSTSSEIINKDLPC